MGLSAYIVSRLKFDQTKKNYVLCLVCLVLLVLILSLRHPSMGNDLRYGEASGYLGTFKRIARMSFNSLFTESVMNYEIGFVIFNKIIGLLSINEQYFLFMTSIAALLPITYMIFIYIKDPLFSFFVYMGMPVFIMMFSGLLGHLPYHSFQLFKAISYSYGHSRPRSLTPNSMPSSPGSAFGRSSLRISLGQSTYLSIMRRNRMIS